MSFTRRSFLGLLGAAVALPGVLLESFGPDVFSLEDLDEALRSAMRSSPAVTPWGDKYVVFLHPNQVRDLRRVVPPEELERWAIEELQHLPESPNLHNS